jgi:hypothetical protein
LRGEFYKIKIKQSSINLQKLNVSSRDSFILNFVFVIIISFDVLAYCSIEKLNSIVPSINNQYVIFVIKEDYYRIG